MNTAYYAGDKAYFLGFMGPIMLILLHFYNNREFSLLELKNPSFCAISARKYSGRLCAGRRIALLLTSSSGV